MKGRSQGFTLERAAIGAIGREERSTLESKTEEKTGGSKLSVGHLGGGDVRGREEGQLMSRTWEKSKGRELWCGFKVWSAL